MISPPRSVPHRRVRPLVTDLSILAASGAVAGYLAARTQESDIVPVDRVFAVLTLSVHVAAAALLAAGSRLGAGGRTGPIAVAVAANGLFLLPLRNVDLDTGAGREAPLGAMSVLAFSVLLAPALRRTGRGWSWPATGALLAAAFAVAASMALSPGLLTPGVTVVLNTAACVLTVLVVFGAVVVGVRQHERLPLRVGLGLGAIGAAHLLRSTGWDGSALPPATELAGALMLLVAASAVAAQAIRAAWTCPATDEPSGRGEPCVDADRAGATDRCSGRIVVR